MASTQPANGLLGGPQLRDASLEPVLAREPLREVGGAHPDCAPVRVAVVGDVRLVCESIERILWASLIPAAVVDLDAVNHLPIQPEGVILVLRSDDQVDAAVARIEHWWPGPKAVLVTCWSSSRIRLRTSVVHRLEISDPVDRLVTAVNRALRGAPAITPGYTARANNGAPPHLGVLTAREREVLALLAVGRSTVQIAGRMGVSENTVRAHIANIRAKLGVRTQLEAVRLVHRPVSVMAPSWTR